MASAQGYYKILHALGSAAGHSTMEINSALMHIGWAGGQLTYKGLRNAGKLLNLGMGAIKTAVAQSNSTDKRDMNKRPRSDTDATDDTSDGSLVPSGSALAPSAISRRSVGQETAILNHAPSAPWPYKATFTTHMRTHFGGIWKQLPTTITSLKSLSVRPTSIYSIFTGTTPGTYAGTAAGDLSTQTTGANYTNFAFNPQPVPAYRPLMEQIYQKYCVLACNYKITISAFDTATQQDWCFGLLETGVTAVPTLIAADFTTLPGMQIKYLQAPKAGIGGDSSVYFTGTYYPGDYGEDVVTDTLAETWTAVAKNGGGSTPALQELLTVYACPANSSARTNARDFYIHWDMDYVVQFKGQYIQFQYQNYGTTIWDVTYPQIYGRYP